MPYDIPMALIGRILGANVFVLFFPTRCAVSSAGDPGFVGGLFHLHVIMGATKRDSSAMKTIAIMTVAFLPAIFLAAFFVPPALEWERKINVQMNGFQLYTRSWLFLRPS